MTKLERFEALVLKQQPAAEPWLPVTPYDFESRQTAEGDHPRLIREVFQPQRVFDFGCGPGHLVALLRIEGIEAVGYEPSRALVNLESLIARPHIRRDLALKPQYDLVICREVLEHLTILEIRKVVAILCKLSSRYVYVTTRFAKSPKHWLDVDTSDDLDPTHMTLLSQPLLRLLFILEGFRHRADLEAQMDWQKQGRCLVYERS